ncbi:MAG: hypothetical protein IJT72_00450 [Lachnospiraceae bacterium]|nr:hypothetical protein [Lachnospiraceae bacterium]
MDNLIYDSNLNKQFDFFDDEEETERDRDNLINMYPAKARLIMVLVEDACDRLEYEGSPMFAELPDKENIRITADRIYNKIKCRDNDETLRQLIEIMLCNEFYARRCRYRRRRRFF